MGERLGELAQVARWRGQILEVPASELAEKDWLAHDFAHHIAYDTTRIRTELGYKEVLPREVALVRTLEYENETLEWEKET
jgi:hypothetical protein